MVTIKRKQTASHNPQLSEMIDDAKKEKMDRLHIQLPERLMQKLRIQAVEEHKKIREIVIEALEKLYE